MAEIDIQSVDEEFFEKAKQRARYEQAFVELEERLLAEGKVIVANLPNRYLSRLYYMHRRRLHSTKQQDGRLLIWLDRF